MKNKKYFLIPLFAFLLVGVFVIGFSMNNNLSNNVADTVEYHAMVCKQVTRADGTIEPSECSSNVLYNTGKDLIRTYLGDTGGGTDEVDQIELGNASLTAETPLATKTEAFTAWTACGLAKATGTYVALGENGNWTIDNEFTSSCDDVLTNVTRLGNTAGTDFAGNSFTLVTLQTNDKLSINWTIWSAIFLGLI